MKLTELERIRQLAGLREFNDPEGQFTTTAAPTNANEPKKGFAVRVIGTFGPDTGGTFASLDLWEALERILPNDYPTADFQDPKNRQNTPQSRVLRTVARQGSAIVKTGIASQDMAETIASKFENYRGQVSPNHPIPAEVIALDQ
jgi:hypothetical protein